VVTGAVTAAQFLCY